jgi:hypothetical protein
VPDVPFAPLVPELALVPLEPEAPLVPDVPLPPAAPSRFVVQDASVEEPIILVTVKVREPVPLLYVTTVPIK